MKLKYFLPVLAFGLLVLQGCSDDDDGLKNVPETIKSAFNQKYPGKSVREWEKKSGYYVAEFSNDNRSADAWFTPSGSWVRTETDYIGALPAAVSDYISQNYPIAVIDDQDWIETPTDQYFEIELEQRKKKDVTLYIRNDGTVLKIVDGNAPSRVTEEVKNAFAQKYPNTNVREWEEKMNHFVAEFTYNNSEAEAWFTTDGTWVRTEVDYRGSLPTAVEQFINENYPTAIIDDVDLIEVPTGKYYEIELEQRGDRDIYVNIKEDGTLFM